MNGHTLCGHGQIAVNCCTCINEENSSHEARENEILLKALNSGLIHPKWQYNTYSDGSPMSDIFQEPFDQDELEVVLDSARNGRPYVIQNYQKWLDIIGKFKAQIPKILENQEIRKNYDTVESRYHEYREMAFNETKKFNQLNDNLRNLLQSKYAEFVNDPLHTNEWKLLEEFSKLLP